MCPRKKKKEKEEVVGTRKNVKEKRMHVNCYKKLNLLINRIEDFLYVE